MDFDTFALRLKLIFRVRMTYAEMFRHIVPQEPEPSSEGAAQVSAWIEAPSRRDGWPRFLWSSFVLVVKWVFCQDAHMRKYALVGVKGPLREAHSGWPYYLMVDGKVVPRPFKASFVVVPRRRDRQRVQIVNVWGAALPTQVVLGSGTIREVEEEAMLQYYSSNEDSELAVWPAREVPILKFFN